MLHLMFASQKYSSSFKYTRGICIMPPCASPTSLAGHANTLDTEKAQLERQLAEETQTQESSTARVAVLEEEQADLQRKIE